MTVLSRLRPRRVQGGDDGVAILMALAYIGIFTTLMLAMLAVVIGQVKPTGQARKDIGSVNAAASGLQAALTRLRSSVDATGDGNRGRLPCTAGSTSTTRFTQGSAASSTPGAKMLGAASNLPGRFRYEVSVAYFAEDPTDQNPAWLQSNALACPLPSTPLYAYLQSYGVGDAVVSGTANRGNRSQTGVYQFSVPQENIAGGRMAQIGGNRYCLDTGSEAPTIGTKLYFQTCSPLGAVIPQQLFEYRKDLSIFYGGKPSLNLCVQASATEQPNLQRCIGTGNGSTYAYAAGQQVQEWSFNDNGHFASAANDGNVTNSCIQPASSAVGAQLTFFSCQGSTDAVEAFDPDPSVGAGKAGGNTTGIVGSPTNQYVNFEQFGRCLDVTSQDVNQPFLIAYPCKQAPDSTKLTWNQVWRFEVLSGSVGRMYTLNRNDVNQPYCLTAAASGEFITATPCTNPLALNQQFTATGLVPGSPQTSYNLVSKSRNQCMSLGSKTATNFGSSKVILEPCSGALVQRWNAPPPSPNSGLNNIKEGTAVQFGG